MEDRLLQGKQATVLCSIIQNFRAYSEKPAFHWLDRDCKVVKSYSYGELDTRTLEIARGLQLTAQEKKSSSKTVVLCYTPGLEFILGFLGCLRAGLIPVPVKSPDTNEVYYKRNLLEIVRACEASFVLSNKRLPGSPDEAGDRDLDKLVQSTSVEWFCEGHTEVYCEEKTKEETNADDKLDTSLPQDVAFLQYTTTGNLNGVMVSYGNLLHNFELMEESYCTSNSTTEMCLLPHFNGFALVGSYLHTLYKGATSYFMSPKAFFDRPAAWMDAMSKYRITHAKVPGSAFFNSIDSQPINAEEINLECVDCIACLEPISFTDLNKFEEYMSKFGLKRNVVSVGYGLAEHTALVSSVCNRKGVGRSVRVNRVSHGKPLSSVAVKIVDQLNFVEKAEGDIGEVWVDSKSKAMGYFRDEQSTHKVFKAKLRGVSEDYYLRTGDLGFMQNGELYICDKMEDVLSVQARGIYPLDIESAAECVVPAICRGKSIAFHFIPARPDNEISILAELKSTSPREDYDKFRSEISAKISEDFKLPVYAVFFFNPLTMPCTTFGRCQRSLAYKLRLTSGVHAYKWLESKRDLLGAKKKVLGSPSSPTSPNPKLSLEPGSTLSSSSNMLLPISENTECPTLESKLSSERKLASVPDIKSLFSDDMATPGTQKSRRVSAPAIPSSNTQPKKITNKRMKRARSVSDDLLGESSIETLLRVIEKAMGRTIAPGEKIWEDESSSEIDKVSTALQKECGFNMDDGTLLLAQSPKALLEVMKMSLLSAEQVHKVQESEYFEHFMSRVYRSVCRISLDKVDVRHNDDNIAIIGMGGSFAGCKDINELWDLMVGSQTELVSQDSSKGIAYTRSPSDLLSSMDISLLDPHEVMLLQSVKKCLANAGFASTPAKCNWGVFAALPFNTSVTASCIAKVYNFTGPIITTKTLSGSLYALSVACDHLQSNKCTAAVFCGARAILDLSSLPSVEDGFLHGEGSGALLLMKVTMARHFGRRILAVVKAVSSRNSPADRPNQESQTQLLKYALHSAKVAPNEVVYIESDAKGTKCGGSIEMDSIQEIFGSESEDVSTVAIGSVKTNIGDLEGAAGIASLIKTVMVLEHAQAPGNPCLNAPEPTNAINRNLMSFHTDIVNLSGMKQGRLVSAVVNSFCHTSNTVAVVQQYSVLPHMALVSTWLLLAADTVGAKFWLTHETEKNSTFYGCFDTLKSQLPIFSSALTYFNLVFEATCKLYNFKPLEKAVASFNVTVLKLYYGIMAQLSYSCLDIPMIACTNAMNEVAALLFAGSIELRTAILFMSCTQDPQELAKLMTKPKIAVYSCVKDKRLSEETFSEEESRVQYASELVANIERGDALKWHMYMMLTVKGPYRPLLHIASDDIPLTGELSKNGIFTISFRHLKNGNCTRYLCEKYLGLRRFSDDTPSKTNMTGFYNYFRENVEGKLVTDNDSGCEVSRQKLVGTEDTSSQP